MSYSFGMLTYLINMDSQFLWVPRGTHHCTTFLDQAATYAGVQARFHMMHTITGVAVLVIARAFDSQCLCKFVNDCAIHFSGAIHPRRQYLWHRRQISWRTTAKQKVPTYQPTAAEHICTDRRKNGKAECSGLVFRMLH